MMEDEVIKALENITGYHIFPVIHKVVIMDFDFKISKEQFRKFEEWLISKGFNNMRNIDRNEYYRLYMELGYNVEHVSEDDLKRRVVRYQHIDGKKSVTITYTVDDAVTIESIFYFEKVW